MPSRSRGTTISTGPELSVTTRLRALPATGVAPVLALRCDPCRGRGARSSPHRARPRPLSWSCASAAHPGPSTTCRWRRPGALVLGLCPAPPASAAVAAPVVRRIVVGSHPPVSPCSRRSSTLPPDRAIRPLTVVAIVPPDARGQTRAVGLAARERLGWQGLQAESRCVENGHVRDCHRQRTPSTARCSQRSLNAPTPQGQDSVQGERSRCGWRDEFSRASPFPRELSQCGVRATRRRARGRGRR